MADVPICGKFDETVSSTWDRLLGLFGIVGIVTIIAGIIQAYETALEVPGWIVAIKGFLAFFGLALSGYVIVAIVAAIIVSYILWTLWFDDCVATQAGESRCMSGVVERINAENWGWVLMPDHPSIDLVVRTPYIVLLLLGADTVDCSDADGSILRVFFKSGRICAVRLAGAIGGTVGAVVGAVVGAIAGVALGAALGCAATGPGILICLLVLLIVVLIVIAAAAVCALIAGAITAAATSETTPSTSPGDTIEIGDLVSAKGPTAINKNYNGQAVQYFNECCARIGQATREGPFSNSDADEFISDTADACPLSC